MWLRQSPVEKNVCPFFILLLLLLFLLLLLLLLLLEGSGLLINLPKNWLSHFPYNSHSATSTESGNKICSYFQFSSVQFSRSVMSDSLRPHEPQHARPPCLSPTPRVHSNSCPSSRWCHPAISFSVVPLSSCPQSLPASESFPMSQLFAWGGQSIGVSALALFLPKNTQDWSPLEWTGWISLQSKGLSGLFSNTKVQKHQFFGAQLSSQSNSHIHKWPLEKTIVLTRWTFVGKVMSLLFNMLSRLVITFLPRSKHLLISWLQSPSAVILEPPKIKSDTVFTVSPSISHEVMGRDAMILVFWMLSFKPTFSLSYFTFIKSLFSSSSLSAISQVIKWEDIVYITFQLRTTVIDFCGSLLNTADLIVPF